MKLKRLFFKQAKTTKIKLPHKTFLTTLKNVFKKVKPTADLETIKKTIDLEVRKVPKAAKMESAVYSGRLDIGEIFAAIQGWVGTNAIITNPIAQLLMMYLAIFVFFYTAYKLTSKIYGKWKGSKFQLQTLKRKERMLEAKIKRMEKKRNKKLKLKSNVVEYYILGGYKTRSDFISNKEKKLYKDTL